MQDNTQASNLKKLIEEKTSTFNNKLPKNKEKKSKKKKKKKNV